MKKIGFLVLFLLIFSLAFAQVSPENQWLIGTWIDDEGDMWTFNSNGTINLSWDTSTSYYYSINNSMNLLVLIY